MSQYSNEIVGNFKTCEAVNALNEMYKQVPEAAKAEGVDFYVSESIFKEIEPLLIDGKFKGCKVINAGDAYKKGLAV